MNSNLKNPHVKNRRHNEGCCSINFAKTFFHVYNFFFFGAGCAVSGVGIWTVIAKHQYINLLTNITYPLTAYLLIVAGALTFIGVILGCISVERENRCLLIFCTFLLLLIFLLEAMVGILAYVYKNQVEVDLNHNLDNTFIEKYGISLSVTFSINKMQQEYKCCGATSFENWDKSRWRKESNTTNLVPDSCCKTMDIGCGQSNHPSNISYTGCIHKFTAELKKQLDIIFAVGLGISVIQIFGMILTCFLYFKLKRDDD